MCYCRTKKVIFELSSPLITVILHAFSHGGPGAGCHPNARRLFDPEVYRIILLVQRGAGRSKPTAEIKVSLYMNFKFLVTIINIFVRVSNAQTHCQTHVNMLSW